jgi:hypothetical protein
VAPGRALTNLTRPAERVSKFYNGRGTAEHWIKEGKLALRWTRLSCRAFRDNAVRLQLFALAYNLANFLRSLALPREVEQWSLTTLRENLVKIGARIVRHGRYVIFQLAEVAVPGRLRVRERGIRSRWAQLVLCHRGQGRPARTPVTLKFAEGPRRHPHTTMAFAPIRPDIGLCLALHIAAMRDRDCPQVSQISRVPPGRASVRASSSTS